MEEQMLKCAIIPSATLVPVELQNIGKLPAIIYPVNQRIVFDYLFEQYKENYEKIKVVCYCGGDKVHRRLEKYPQNIVEIVDLTGLDDLGHTVYWGIRDISESIVINFADTIVFRDRNSIDGDCIYYAEDYVTDTWTYFREENGKILEIIDKADSLKIQSKEKLIVGLFSISDTPYFRDCLERAFEGYTENISTFYYALKLYSQKHPMTSVKTDDWLDIGHIDTYFNSSLEVKAREFNHISIDKHRGILTKTSDDREKFIGEIKWYLKLPGDVEYVRPRIFDYSTKYDAPHVSMEYYAYHTIHELFLYGDLTYHQWTDIFERIRYICDDFKRYTIVNENFQESLQEMYLTKTLQRLNRLREDSRFSAFFSQEIVVNGKTYCSLEKISEILRKIVPETLYDVEQFCIIHGDLCFANIMVDSNFSFVKVIDPRGKFGKYDIYGDFRYELAKLFHSVDGKYDFIIKDLCKVDYDLANGNLSYDIYDRKRDYDLYGIFCEVFEKEIGSDLKKIELIESLLFLSMIPLHSESIDHQMAMLGTGVDILNRVTDITVYHGV